jgi:hypothetical protein
MHQSCVLLAEDFQNNLTRETELVIRYPEEFVDVCLLGSKEQVMEAISFLLARALPDLRSFYQMLASALIKRLARDESLQELMWARLSSATNSSEQCTFASSLGAALGVVPELRDWAKKQIQPGAIQEDLRSLGTDLVTFRRKMGDSDSDG